MKVAFMSLLSSVVKGNKSTKRALLLFDKVVIPTSKNRIDIQIERFADGDRHVSNYLKKKLLPIDFLSPSYTDLIEDLLKYFNDYYWENWLSPDFEKDVGVFHTPTEANMSWAHSLVANSRLLSNLIREEKKIECYCDFGALQENVESTYTTDNILPDPASLNWDSLIPILDSEHIAILRQKIWNAKTLKRPLSSDYLQSLEEFFSKHYPENVEKNAFVNFSELLLSTGAIVYAPAKSLYQIYNNRKIHNQYQWVSLIQKMQKTATSTHNEGFDEEMEDYLSLFPYG